MYTYTAGKSLLRQMLVYYHIIYKYIGNEKKERKSGEKKMF